MTGLTALLERGGDVAAALASGASPEARDDDGRLPLVVAAASGPIAAVEALLRAGASPDRTDRWGGLTPLLGAIGGGHELCFRRLIAAGASVKTVSRRADPAIVVAARSGSLAIVEALLAAGADPNETTSDQRTALRAAVEGGHAASVRILLDSGAVPAARAEVPLPITAARRGHVDVLRALGDGGLDLAARDPRGRDALDHARRTGQVACVDLLRARGVDPASAHPIDRLAPAESADQHRRVAQLARLVDVGVDELLDVLECPIAAPAQRLPQDVDLASAHAALLAIADGVRLVVEDDDERSELRVLPGAEIDAVAEDVGAERHLAPISVDGWVPHVVSCDARTGAVLDTDYELDPAEWRELAPDVAAWLRTWVRARR